jgi:hypothetical protein
MNLNWNIYIKIKSNMYYLKIKRGKKQHRHQSNLPPLSSTLPGGCGCGGFCIIIVLNFIETCTCSNSYCSEDHSTKSSREMKREINYGSQHETNYTEFAGGRNQFKK